MSSNGKLSPIITGTRRLLLEHLLSSDENAVSLADKVGINISAVRNHLAVLELNGLVSSRLMRATRGRPKRLYSLTPFARSLFPRRFDRLLLNTLLVLQDHLDDRKLVAAIQAIAKRLWNEIGPSPISGSLQRRLDLIVKALDDFGFYAALIKQRQVYVIEIRNCIFQDLRNGDAGELVKRLCLEFRKLINQALSDAEVEWFEPIELTDHVHRAFVKERRSG